jgi:hypothetical protein
VVFDECDFRGVNLTESEHAGSAFRNCTFDPAILHHLQHRVITNIWELTGKAAYSIPSYSLSASAAERTRGRGVVRFSRAVSPNVVQAAEGTPPGRQGRAPR